MRIRSGRKLSSRLHPSRGLFEFLVKRPLIFGKLTVPPSGLSRAKAQIRNREDTVHFLAFTFLLIHLFFAARQLILASQFSLSRIPLGIRPQLLVICVCCSKSTYVMREVNKYLMRKVKLGSLGYKTVSLTLPKSWN